MVSARQPPKGCTPATAPIMFCRWAGTRKELCMDNAKWKDLNRRIPFGAKGFDWAEMGSNWTAQTRL
jgi:hypothetical protein